jgi:EmrB/QacA subfamily drug resistance transporter
MTGRDKIVLTVLAAAQFMLIVDVVVVNVALPSVRTALGIAEGQLALTAVAYTVTFGSLLIAAGRLGDAIGRRRMFVSGIVTFTVASLVTGLAQDSWQFFTARAGQGVGAAMVSANALALLLSRFETTSARNKAMGVWGAVGSGGAIAGQVLGGVVVDTVGWRWIFLLNVPLGIVAAIVAAKHLHESRAGSQSVDLSGSLLLVGGLAPAVLALAWLPGRGLDPVVLTSAMVGLLVLGAFAVQQRTSGAPLVPRRLLTTPGVLPGNAVIAMSSATVTASLFFTTLYMQVVLGHSALTVGLAFAPITVLIMGLSPLTARLVSRMGARVPLVTGLVVGAGGMLLLSRMAADGSYWTHVLPALLAIAVGSALTYVPTYIAATAQVGADDQGAASGLVSTSQELGPAVGLAGIAAVAASFAAGPVAAELVEGYRAGLVAAAVITAAGVVAAWRVPRDLGRATEHASDMEPGEGRTKEAALAQ